MVGTIPIHLLKSNRIFFVKKGEPRFALFYACIRKRYLCLSDSSPAVTLNGSLFCFGGMGQVAKGV